MILAFQLLTTIPIRKEITWDDRRAKASVAFYPLTGLFLGLLLAIQAYLLLSYTPLSTLIVTAWLMTFSIVYSGGLHLDGWADFSDAIFSRQDTERKLEIMKDSRIGAFGVLSLLLLLGWRFILIYELIKQLDVRIVLAFVLIPFLVRFLMGAQLLLGSFARENGMARALMPAKFPSMKKVFVGWFVFGCVIIFSVDAIWLSLFVSTLLFLSVWLRFCYQQIGGITGDTIGAGAEGGETWLWLTTLLLHSFVMA
jgi:adenosylcobinamide-GDP ribazoletransferase